MVNHNAADQETLVSAMSKTELFFEQNGRKLIYALAAIIVLIGLIFGYRALVVAPRAEKASAQLAAAQYRFEGENPNYKAALEGDANGVGFLDVVENYGSTAAGNLAKHYAGMCYLHMGDMQNAATYLAKFSPVKGIPGAIVNAQNYGLQGDVAVELDDLAGAIKFYDKAVDAADNALTAPMFLRKAGITAQAMGNVEVAKSYYQRILDQYPASFDAREAEKLLGTVN